MPDGSVRNYVPMMFTTDSFLYAENEQADAKLIQIPFQIDGLYFVGVLPRQPQDFNKKILANIDAILGQQFSETHTVDLWLPQGRATSQYSFHEKVSIAPPHHPAVAVFTNRNLSTFSSKRNLTNFTNSTKPLWRSPRRESTRRMKTVRKPSRRPARDLTFTSTPLQVPITTSSPLPGGRSCPTSRSSFSSRKETWSCSRD